MRRDRPRRVLLQRVAFGLLVLLLACAGLVSRVLYRVADMPGASYESALEPWSPADHDLAAKLDTQVRYLAGLGPRSLADVVARAKAATWIRRQLEDLGLAVQAETFSAGDGVPSMTNLVVPLGGPGGAPLLVISAHMDTVPGSVGADDDATGVAALLEIAERFAAEPIPAGASRYRIELCFFDGEEAGYERMGSGYHARALAAAGEQVAGAISLEMLGYFTDAPDSQSFPSAALGPLYPNSGNFIAFVGSEGSRDFIRSAVGAFREVAQFPSEGLVAPDSIRDVRRSDHVHFIDQGWPGLMVTDTANFRNPHYHESTDTPERIDSLALARVTRGLEGMIRLLASPSH